MSNTAPAGQVPAKRSKTPNQIVSTNVRAILRANDVDQAWLAEKLDQNEMWLSRRLSDNTTTTFSTDEVSAVAEVLRVEVGELFADRRTIGGGSTLLGVTPLHRGWKVGPEGLEPPASSVKSGELAEVIVGPWPTIDEPTKALG
jgi:hypothetical protein